MKTAERMAGTLKVLFKQTVANIRPPPWHARFTNMYRVIQSYLNKISTHFNNSIVYHVHQLSANLKELCKDAFYQKNRNKSVFCKMFFYCKTQTNVHARYYLNCSQVTWRVEDQYEELITVDKMDKYLTFTCHKKSTAPFVSKVKTSQAAQNISLNSRQATGKLKKEKCVRGNEKLSTTTFQLK